MNYNQNGFKPHGFWYSIKNQWYTFIKTEMNNNYNKYIYELKLYKNSLINFDESKDTTKILVIKTLEDAILFPLAQKNIVIIK